MNKKWNAEELEILVQNGATKTPEELLELLPGRTWNSIDVKRHRLGVRRDLTATNYLHARRRKISNKMVQEMIDKYIAGKTCIDLGQEYDINESHVYRLIFGIEDCRPEIVRPLDRLRAIADQNREQAKFQKGLFDHKHDSLPNLTTTQLDILTGSLLGDGCLVVHRNRKDVYAHFILGQCPLHQEYVNWFSDTLGEYSKTISPYYSDNKAIRKNGNTQTVKCEKRLVQFRLRTINHPIFSEMERKWYARDADGKYLLKKVGDRGRSLRIKTVPDDINLTSLTLAVWFCEDGHNNYKGRAAQIATQAFSQNALEMLSVNLQRNFDLRPRVRKGILFFYSDQYDRFIDIIRPHVVWDCFQYKIKHRHRTSNWTRRKVVTS